MSLRAAAYDNLAVAGNALQALARGDDSTEAAVGGILLAEGLHCLRALAKVE